MTTTYLSLQSAKALMKPTEDWGPYLKEHRVQKPPVSSTLDPSGEAALPLTKV